LHSAVCHRNLVARAVGNMRRDRRKVLIRFFERAALGVVILDAVAYFAAVRPLHSRLAATESSYHRVLEQVQQRQERVERLEKFQKNLPTAHEQLKTFLNDHVPSRRHAFSDAARLIRVLTTQSGVQLDNVSYKLTSEKDEPLERLRLSVTVEGPFTNLLKFAHTLESAQQLILLRNFTFATGQGSTVSLQVGAELFLTP
jgi:Tfp pilus assembly protein PilO